MVRGLASGSTALRASELARVDIGISSSRLTLPSLGTLPPDIALLLPESPFKPASEFRSSITRLEQICCFLSYVRHRRLGWCMLWPNEIWSTSDP